MRVEIFTHTLDRGWSRPSLPEELDTASTLVIAFGAPEYMHQPQALMDLGAAFPQAVKAGCSTAGEIVGDTIADRSLVVAVVQFARTQVALAAAPITIDSSFEAGTRLGALLARDDLATAFLLSDGLQVNGSALAEGISDRLGSSVMVAGGLAGDGDRFAQSWVWQGREPESGMVLAVGLYGKDVVCHHGSYGGWSLFGPARKVTRSSSSTLYELDGQPALDLYKRYLGEHAEGLPSSGLLFPLALRKRLDDDEYVVRTILAVDEDARSITFAGSIPEGSYAQLMTASFDRLIDGAEQAARMLRVTYPTEVAHTLLIGVSCVGRRLLLGERAEEELEAVLEGMVAPPPFIGFYSYGEISPNIRSVGCSLKNQTMTLTWLMER